MCFVPQGSHVTAHCATYVLQWKFFEKPALHSHSPLDVIDSFTAPHHKAKVMYYYEVRIGLCKVLTQTQNLLEFWGLLDLGLSPT
jgi:hypothetical protein